MGVLWKLDWKGEVPRQTQTTDDVEKSLLFQGWVTKSKVEQPVFCRMGKRKTIWHREKKNKSKVGSEGQLGMFLAEVEQVVLSCVSSLV